MMAGLFGGLPLFVGDEDGICISFLPLYVNY